MVYILRRAGQALLVLVLAYTAAYMLLAALPGDAVLARYGSPELGLSPEQLAEIRAAYGADRSLVERYVEATLAFLRGDLGYSVQSGAAVSDLIATALPATLVLAGIAIVVCGYSIGAMDQTGPDYQSVLSQLAGAIAGHGIVYYVAMASLLSVLCLSANTSFVGFPRLSRLIAQDDYLPRAFATSDRRLVLSAGIVFLTVSAGGLLVLFGGITDRLIPLFAVGAFLTFTMSQIGMVAHWRRQGAGHGHRLLLNAVGAVATGIALAVIVAAKFVEGAWIVILAIPAIMAALALVHRYADALHARMHAGGPFRIEETRPPTVLVAYESRNRMTDRALRFAMTLSPDVLAVHLLHLTDPEREEHVAALKDAFDREICAPLRAAGITPPRLAAIPAPYRDIEGPLMTLVDKIDTDTPGRSVAILIPEYVPGHVWERLLHSRRAARLRAALLARANPRLMVISAPWRA